MSKSSTAFIRAFQPFDALCTEVWHWIVEDALRCKYKLLKHALQLFLSSIINYQLFQIDRSLFLLYSYFKLKDMTRYASLLLAPVEGLVSSIFYIL